MRTPAILAALIALLAQPAHAAPELPLRCKPWLKDTIRCGIQRVDDELAKALSANKSAKLYLVFESGTTDQDLATAARTPWVWSLEIESKSVTSLSGLSSLTALAELRIGSPLVTSIEPLAKLTGLRTLMLTATTVADLTPIAGLPLLEDLWLSGRARDLSPLSGRTSLRALHAADLKDWSVVKTLTGLESLVAHKPSFKDVSFLANAKGLKKLQVFGGKELVDISALGSEVRELDVRDSRVVDVSVLSKMPKLTLLSLANTPVTSIASLAKTTTLERVDLSGTAIKDLTPLLASAKNLQQLLPPDGTPDSALAPFKKANPKIWFHETY